MTARGSTRILQMTPLPNAAGDSEDSAGTGHRGETQLAATVIATPESAGGNSRRAGAYRWGADFSEAIP